ncbi:MAG TPA: hypothetical protein PLY68_07980 [Myxococcota bacterium]|nr:hypothetical protein [Myxococcota bacterium]HQP96112.1 hypothetical protein [Myxococcota bacterium]
MKKVVIILVVVAATALAAATFLTKRQHVPVVTEVTTEPAGTPLASDAGKADTSQAAKRAQRKIRPPKAEYPGQRDFTAPGPITASEYVARTAKDDAGSTKSSGLSASGLQTDSMLPDSGPASADRVIEKARVLRDEGRADEAGKLLNNALLTERNPYARRLLTNELADSSRMVRSPAGSDSTTNAGH